MNRFLRRCALVIALACSGVATSAFALTSTDVASLAGDDFDAKAAAIDALAAQHDAASLALLSALADGRVLATDAGSVLIEDNADDTQARDALSGRVVPIGNAQPVMLNNLLRNKVTHALAGMQLMSPDLAVRRAAADTLLANPDASMKPFIEAARAKETDPVLKRRLDVLWATTSLTDSDAAKRLEAVELVAARHDLDLFPLLRALPHNAASMRSTRSNATAGSSARSSPAFRSAACCFSQRSGWPSRMA